jgi:hypothetical protein
MTETEWLGCKNPEPMLELLWGKVSDRKLRLFACAYGRAVRDSQHLPGPSTVAVAEQYADGLVSYLDLASERRRWAFSPEERGPVAQSAYDGAWEAVGWLTHTDQLMKIDPDALRHLPIPADAVLKRSVLLLRDIFGPLPFRPVPIDPAWLAWNDGTVPRLAQAAYEHRSLPDGHLDPSRLAVLADALEDAGCTDPDILNHCRTPGVHVRGCWVVDLLLGKG